MASEKTVPTNERPPTADQLVVTDGVPWDRFEEELALRGDRSGPRIAFLDGALETTSPSKDHERIKSYIGCLIEAYALERDIDLSPCGGWTLKKAAKEAGLEPDECYLIGDQERDTPDLAIEVVWTRGGLDKLEIYRRLGVREVWRWKKSRIEVYVLRDERYENVRQSEVFPDLDVSRLCSFLSHPTAMQAVKAFRETLHSE
jgi:Uma2 family endonuclease